MREGNILMVQHQHDGRVYWTLPGGGVEPGERPDQAVVREVAEEVTLHGIVGRLLFEQVVRAGNDLLELREYCFLVDVDQCHEPSLGYDPELPPDAQMLTTVAWFPVEQVREDRQVSKVLVALESA